MALAPAGLMQGLAGFGATPLPGHTFASPIPGTNLYIFPAWNGDTKQYDFSLQVPDGASTVTLADVQAGYYGTAAQAYAGGGNDNDPNSPTFNPDPSVEGYSVAYWVMKGQSIAQAQANAAKWAAAVHRPVESLADVGPIGPGDPLYQRLAAMNALSLATLAPQVTMVDGSHLDTTYTTPPGTTLPVNPPATVFPTPHDSGSMSQPTPGLPDTSTVTGAGPMAPGIPASGGPVAMPDGSGTGADGEDAGPALAGVPGGMWGVLAIAGVAFAVIRSRKR